MTHILDGEIWLCDIGQSITCNIGGGGSSSDNSGQQAAATTVVNSGAQKGTYQNGPQNATQIGGALGSAQDLFQNGSPTVSNGLNNINQGAAAAGDIYAGANPQLKSTINGSYLSAGNPGFQGLITQLGQAIKPSIDGQFEANGRGGSGANANAYASALANKAGDLAYQNYGAERTIQNNDIQNLPSYTAGMFTPGQAQLTAGYTPINQYINQLKSISPGSAGSFDTTTSGASTSNSNGSSSGSASGVNYGAQTKK